MIKYFLLLLLLIPFYSKTLYALDDSKILKGIFNSCIGKEAKVNPNKFLYCGCTASKIGKYFTMQEFIELSKKIGKLPQNKMDEEFSKNNKIVKSGVECLKLLRRNQ